MLRYRDRRIRIPVVPAILSALALVCLALWLTRPTSSGGGTLTSSVPDSLVMAAMIACPAALIFLIWLLANERRRVNRRYLVQSARNRVNAAQTLRLLATIFGAAGVIVGALALIYVVISMIRPDIDKALNLELLGLQSALGSFALGGGLYAAGKLGRR